MLEGGMEEVFVDCFCLGRELSNLLCLNLDVQYHI